MHRRPHRSFRLTKRRDYKRSLKLPGYWAFTSTVWTTLRSQGKAFGLVVVIYAAFGMLFGMMANQEVYNQIGELFQQSSSELPSGDFDSLLQAVLLSVAAFGGGAQSLTEVQQVYAVLLFLLVWLTTVWLLREFLAGGKPRVRDGLYNSASPLVSTFLIFAVLLVQLVPLGILGVIYTALSGINLLTDGMPVFLFSMLALLVIVLTLYWVTTTFVALVVVALPGMYPMQAFRTASDLVIGRRLRLLYRLLWLAGLLLVVWLVIMVPLVMFDTWLRSVWSTFAAVPLVPFVGILLSAASTVWAASYVYLLYRKAIDDDSAPA